MPNDTNGTNRAGFNQRPANSPARPSGPNGPNNAPRPPFNGTLPGGARPGAPVAPRPAGPNAPRPGGPMPNRGPGGPGPARGPGGPGGPGPARGPGGFGGPAPARGPGGPGGGFNRGPGGPGGPNRGGPGGPNRGPGGPGGPNRGPGGPSRGGNRGRGNAAGRGSAVPGSPRGTATKTRPTGPIVLPTTLLVKDLAELLSATANEVIAKLIGRGIFRNINEVIDYKTAAAVAEDLGFEPSEAAPPPSVTAAKEEPALAPSAPKRNVPRLARPPVVTVMGHVDHGKTSLLDAIRKTRVAAGEAGGITQHIGAYQVETTDGRPVTFLDTPGHEAFTAMRARGAKVTDIAVIVVAADDGVMPQTIEAIDHARAAQVPIVVALNKIDKENANPDFVKQQLAENGVVIEEYGGEVVCVPVSAKKGLGIEDLLENILLVADIQDLKADAGAPAVGTILEARIDKSSGIVANVLVQDGTLKISDIIVTGTMSGKVRAMFDDTGTRIKKAGPSTPTGILALSSVPMAGDQFTVVADERAARQMIEERKQQEALQSATGVALDTLYLQMQQGKLRELNLILKAGVQGSLDALHHQLSKLGTDQFKVRVIHESVGNISENDVHLASASKAIIIGFDTLPDGAAQRVAQNEHVDIRFYDVIYKLVDDIEAALKGMLEPVYKEVVEGHAEILQLFKAGKLIIGGARVTDGKLTRSSVCKVLRNGKVIFTGTFNSLRRGKEDAREVASGFECGITVEDFNDLQVGDVVETTIKVRV